MNSGLPRFLEASLSFAALAFLFPIMATIAAVIKITSEGPVFFIQDRIGLLGNSFKLIKFRSMRVENKGAQVTAGDDERITRIGKLLRKTKLDELPELWNVVKGHLSLVGPRPEVPRYVDLSDPLWQHVLTVRPGITDPMTLKLRNEEDLLETYGAGDAEGFYLGTLQKYKLIGYINYLQNRTWKSDMQILFQSMMTLLIPSKTPPPSLEEINTVLTRYATNEDAFQ